MIRPLDVRSSSVSARGMVETRQGSYNAPRRNPGKVKVEEGLVMGDEHASWYDLGRRSFNGRKRAARPAAGCSNPVNGARVRRSDKMRCCGKTLWPLLFVGW